MKKVIPAIIILALAVYFAIPIIGSGAVAWWGILAYIAWFAFILFIAYMALLYLRGRVENGIRYGRDKVLGYHEFSGRITKAKFLMSLDTLKFSPDSFTYLKGTIKRGKVKAGQFISIYDSKENFICKVKVQKIVISYNEVQFAEVGDTVEINANPSMLNETALPAGSVAVR